MPGTRIIIEAVSPDKMRLPAYREEGCGDWFVDRGNGDIHIQVASMTDVWDDEQSFLIALHELIESRLCFEHGVVEGAVDAFDTKFEKERDEGLRGPEDEPGAASDCPYAKEHRAASLIEYTVAMMLGLWNYGRLE